jgi:hypothetical protein
LVHDAAPAARVEGSLKRRGLRIKAAAENLGSRLAVAAARADESATREPSVE